MMFPLLVAGALLGAVNVDVQPLDGEPVSGALVSLDGERLVIDADGQEKSFRLAELISATRRDGPAAGPSADILVKLVDGSQLAASAYTVESGKAKITLRGGQSVEAATASIDSVRLKKHRDELQKQWLAIEERESAGDRIVIRKTSTVTVENGLEKVDKEVVALDWLEGVLYDITDGQVQFKFNDTLIPVKREKVEGVFYFHAARGSLPDPLCRIRDASGSAWDVRSLALAGDKLQVVSNSGVRAALPLDEITKFDFSTGKILYLSDAEPERVEWTPFFPPTSPSEKQWFSPQNDGKGGFAGGRLELNNRQFTKGLAVHSRTQLVYRVPEGFKRFAALAGIDDRVRSLGSVHLVITGDGETLLEQDVTGKDEEPLAIDLEIDGVRRLGILVDYADNADIADHLNLCNARITK